MFLGKPYRKKRKLLLQAVRAPQAPSSMSSSWRVPRGDVFARELCWYRSVRESHDSFCGCRDPVFHLSRLAARSNHQGPPTPPTDERPSASTPVRRLLPLPSYPGEGPQARWPGGDGEGAGGARGGAGDGGARAGEEEYRPEDLDELFGAIEQEQ